MNNQSKEASGNQEPLNQTESTFSKKPSKSIPPEKPSGNNDGIAIDNSKPRRIVIKGEITNDRS